MRGVETMSDCYWLKLMHPLRLVLVLVLTLSAVGRVAAGTVAESGRVQVVPEWRWLPAADLADPGMAPGVAFRQGEPATTPGVYASTDFSHRLFGGAPAGPRHGLLVGRLDIPDGAQPGFWWLRMSPVAAAVRIQMDGEVVGHAGWPAATGSDEVPDIQPLAVPLGNLSAGTHWLVLQISGHHFKEAAVWGPVWLETGSPQDMPLLWEWMPALLQMGALGVTGIFLLLFGYRTGRRRAAWYLALFAFAMLGRQLLSGHVPEAWFSAAGMQPGVARFTLLMRLEFTFMYLALWAYARTLEVLSEPGRLARKWLAVIRGLSLVCIGVVWLFPPQWFSLTGSPMQLAILAVVGVTVRVGWQAWCLHPAQRPVWLTMLAAVVLPVVHDVLITQFVISGASWLGYGVLGLALSLAVLVTRQVSGPDPVPVAEHAKDAGVVSALAVTGPLVLVPGDGRTTARIPARRRSSEAGQPEPKRVPEGSVTPPRQAEPGVDDMRRAKLVALLARSLALWEFHTGRTKADLAEQSRAWRVYIDGGTAKTRTLDKYLSLKTLPARPRWRQVLRTAGFVINHCELAEEEHAELSALIREVEAAYTDTPVKPVTNASETARYAS